MNNEKCSLAPCSLNHAIYSNHCKRLLDLYSISTNENPHDIILKLKLSSQNQYDKSCSRRDNEVEDSDVSSSENEDSDEEYSSGTSASDSDDSTDESSEESYSSQSEASDDSEDEGSEEDCSSDGSVNSEAEQNEENYSSGGRKSDNTNNEAEDTVKHYSSESRKSDGSPIEAKDSEEKYLPSKGSRDEPLASHQEVSSFDLDQQSLPSTWSEMKPKQTHVLEIVPIGTKEYQKVASRVLLSQPSVNIHKIQRLQNPYLWNLLQSRKADLSKRYNETQLNVQKLFHGVDPMEIDSICKNNIEWRLSMPTVQMFGKGAYFSNSAAVARGHCTCDSDRHFFLILADVIIGAITKGTPDHNGPSNTTFDRLGCETTVDDAATPTIFVKYNKEEYYPQYIIEFT